MGYIQEARENHAKKKVEEEERKTLEQKDMKDTKECRDHVSRKEAECSSAWNKFFHYFGCRQLTMELKECLEREKREDKMHPQEPKGSPRSQNPSSI